MIRSPSFSLPSSSMTTRNSPLAKASKASSIESNLNLFVWPFVPVEGLPFFAGFELEDDRGPDITSLCLKSAMGEEDGGGRDKDMTRLKCTQLSSRVLYAVLVESTIGWSRPAYDGGNCLPYGG